MKNKKIVSLTLASLLSLSLMCSCGEAGVSSDGTVSVKLDGSSIKLGDSTCGTVSGSTLTISEPGTYELSGTLSDGNIIVNLEDGGTAYLILNGVDITCSNSSPIFVKNATKAVITLKDGTENKITDGQKYEFVGEDTDLESPIYSKDDLIINGTGTLTVTGNYANGIVGKDEVTIESGTINVTAINHGIKGKDFLLIKDGNITVTADGDGIKSTNDTSDKKGYVQIDGGKLNITAVDDGISGVTNVLINGGEINIDVDNNGIKSLDTVDIQGGTVTILTDDDGIVCVTQEGSANATVTVNGTALDVSETIVNEDIIATETIDE